MKKLKGFSLIEMTVVMLIFAVTAAAMAPIVNKTTRVTVNEGDPWH